MTSTEPEVTEDVTDDVGALQRLPEDQHAPEYVQPTCATTTVAGGPEHGPPPASEYEQGPEPDEPAGGAGSGAGPEPPGAEPADGGADDGR